MNLIGLDLETTGVDITKDRPVQVCAVQRTGKGHHILSNTLCNPLMPIAPGATEVNGITDEMVLNYPDYSVTCWKLGVLISSMNPDALVTYNGKAFDLPILRANGAGEMLEPFQHLDVMEVAYRYFPTEPSHRLGQIYQRLTGKIPVDAHIALFDIYYTLELLDAISVKVGKSIEHLLEEMKTPKPYSLMPIGKFKGKLLSEVSKGWASWAMQQEGGILGLPDMRLSLDLILRGEA